jgi:hypothetical protein
MKISEWLEQFDSHDIIASQEAKDDFQKETGKAPVWPEYSRKQIRQAIADRGLGGHVTVGPMQTKMANLWEVAEALATRYANFGGSPYEGRGRRFRAAIEALRLAGM